MNNTSIYNWLQKQINKGKIEPQNGTNDFYQTLRGLITAVFAVVIGYGLGGLEIVYQEETDKWFKFIALLVAYWAILLSWWGYHWAKFQGPEEKNILCYIIDFLLLVIYWLLINTLDSIYYILGWYCLMFLLYFLWEFIRSFDDNLKDSDKRKIVQAETWNLFFCIIFLAGYVLLPYCQIGFSQKSFFESKTINFVILFTIVIILSFYRVKIHRAYNGDTKDKNIVFLPAGLTSEHKKLIDQAKRAAKNARAEHSHFKVGAAILANNGKVYTGCNIEFDNYSNTIHAEEAAISSMILSDSTAQPLSIAIYVPGKKNCFPCGMCCQSLFEIRKDHLEVIAACDQHEPSIKDIIELLPEGFRLEKRQ